MLKFICLRYYCCLYASFNGR